MNPAPPTPNAHSLSLDQALLEIRRNTRVLPPERLSLAEVRGRYLRADVLAGEDVPAFDRSAMDGYAIRQDDASAQFRVVDSIRAGDWKPRALQSGEAVRVATGAALPTSGLRVVMQEQARLDGDQLSIMGQAPEVTHVRRRGEDVQQGQCVLRAGTRLDAGPLALLASLGHVQPWVSPRLRVAHLTTGDELVPPHQTPAAGQVRDSNSILVRSFLEDMPGDVVSRHLPEDFSAARDLLARSPLPAADLLLVSGGASVGERDFTAALLEHLGFKILFHQVRMRPGKPVIFATDGARVAFGLPGNPLAHFVCLHVLVATALAVLTGGPERGFLPGRLAAGIEEAACPRETLWPARLDLTEGWARLEPLRWPSSGDVTSLARADALIRIPAGVAALAIAENVSYWPAGVL